MRAFAAKNLLPGEGDDIELLEVEALCECGRSGVADRQAFTVVGMKSAFGTRRPEVVPFQVKTTSRLKSI